MEGHKSLKEVVETRSKGEEVVEGEEEREEVVVDGEAVEAEGEREQEEVVGNFLVDP